MKRTASFFHRTVLFSLCVLWAALTFSTALVEISFTIALIAWTFSKWNGQPTMLWQRKGIVIPLAGFVILSSLSYFWSEIPVLSFRGIFKILQQVFLFLMVADTFSEKKNQSIFQNVFLGVTALLIADTFYQYFRGEDLIRGFKGMGASAGYRVSGPFKTYGILASYLVSTLPFLGAVALHIYRRDRTSFQWILASVMTLLYAVLLYWTRSRGAFLALLVGTFLILFFLKRWKILIAIMILCVGSVFVLPRGMIIHLDGYGKEQSLVERYYLWERAISVILAKPLTGTGINTYAETHEKYDRTKNWRVRRYYAHNGYLQMAAETGLPALLFFLVFLWQHLGSGLRSVYRARGSPEVVLFMGLIFGSFNFLILTAVDTVLHNPQPALTFWYLLGLQIPYREAVALKQVS